MSVTLKTLLLPPAGPLLLAVVGLSLLARRRAGAAALRTGRVLLVAGVASLWLLATPVVGEGLTRLAEHYPALDLSRPAQAQAIVILSGGGVREWAPEYGGPAAAFELLERVSYGAYLARRTGLPVLISGTADDVAAMGAVLTRDFGIRARWVEGESRDTFENAQFSSRLLKADGIARILLVTSSVHEWRASREFVSCGLTVEPAPVHVWVSHHYVAADYLPDAAGLQHSSDALHELVGDAVQALLAWTQLRRHNP